MSISDRLDEIEARSDAANDGPWYAESRNVDDPYSLTTVYNVFHNGDTADRDLVAEVAYDNAEFIAHARTDVPVLVAALRAVLDLCDSTPLRFRPYDGAEPFMVLGVPAIRAEIAAALGEGS